MDDGVVRYRWTLDHAPARLYATKRLDWLSSFICALSLSLSTTPIYDSFSAREQTEFSAESVGRLFTL